MGANPKQRLYKPLISHKGGITLIPTALIHFQCGEIVPVCERQAFIYLDFLFCFFYSEKKLWKSSKEYHKSKSLPISFLQDLNIHNLKYIFMNIIAFLFTL